MKLFLSLVLLAFVFHAAPSGAQERPAVRPIPIPFRENGYSNFESQAFNTKAEFDAFIAGTANQIGWNNRQAFVEALQKANVDFAHEAVVILRHTESAKVQANLRQQALLWGWPAERIRVIDQDQGRSATTVAGRDGFRELLAEISHTRGAEW